MIVDIEYEDEETGRDFKVEFDLNFYRENYGADADGNRGVMTTFCELEGISIKEAYRNGATDKLKRLLYWLLVSEGWLKTNDPALAARLDAWIDGDGLKAAEDQAAEAGEDDGSDYDDDD